MQQQGRLCRSFQEYGSCSYGSRCRFLHAGRADKECEQHESTSYDSPPPNHGRHNAAYAPSVHQSFPQQHVGSSAWRPSGARNHLSPVFRNGGRSHTGGRGRGRGGSFAWGGPEKRRWFSARKQHREKERDSFVLVSYNVLSSRLAADHTAELYWHIPPDTLNWANRWRRILQELKQLEPDVICMQEVDHFEEVQQDLSSLGFEGIYKGRTGADMTDGCATFWDLSKFSSIAQEELEFSDHNLRENVALLTVLKHTGEDEEANSRLVVVANTHILFNPKRGDIKLAQIRHLLEQADDLSKRHHNAPIVIAGDFNSSPESALYHFLSTGSLDLSKTDRRNMSGNTESFFQNHWNWQPYQPSSRISIPESLLSSETPHNDSGLSSRTGGALKQHETPELKRARTGSDRASENGRNHNKSTEAQSPTRRWLHCEPGKTAANDRSVNQDEETAAERDSVEMAISDIGSPLQLLDQAESPQPLLESFAVPEDQSKDKNTGPPYTPKAGNSTAFANAGWQAQQRKDWRKARPPGIDYVWEDEEFLIATGGRREPVVEHPLHGLRSAYATVLPQRFSRQPACSREPVCTTFHAKARGTVDYLWYTPGLTPRRVLDVLRMYSLQQLRGLPNEQWPSDHFSLACEFEFN